MVLYKQHRSPAITIKDKPAKAGEALPTDKAALQGRTGLHFGRATATSQPRAAELQPAAVLWAPRAAAAAAQHGRATPHLSAGQTEERNHLLLQQQ